MIIADDDNDDQACSPLSSLGLFSVFKSELFSVFATISFSFGCSQTRVGISSLPNPELLFKDPNYPDYLVFDFTN